MFMSSLCSGILSYLNKKLYLDSPGITPYEAVYWASIINVIAYLIILRYMGLSPYECVTKRLRTALVLRGVVGIFSNAF